ncbi:MAG: ABC transporter substrate-binding protein [Puniceicoccales bacterium]|jgi:microcin C transport system substrate-binding protein|nr:ABC transporter substrate-binding protein [Puniceicoccales bacterium]
MRAISLILFIAILPALLIATPAAGTPPAALAHYREHPSFYRFATPADLPSGLVWETNNTDPEFASPQAKRGGLIRFSIPTYPPALRRVGPNANHAFRSYLYDAYMIPLALPHPNTDRPIPGTATHWAISPDRKTVYYKLNPSVRFTNGDPVNADDYLYTFYFHRSPHLQAAWYNDFYSTEFAGITKFDDYTIAISLPDERPDPIYNTAIEPTPRKFFGNLTPDFPMRYQNTPFPTVGPYLATPEKIVHQQSITLDRLRDWWGDNFRYYRNRFNASQISYRVVRDPDKAFQMFLIGDLDFMEIRVPKFWYSLNDKPACQQGYIEKHTFHYDRPVPTWGLFINSIKPGLDKPDIRLGIQHATDWQRVISTFFRDDYTRLNQYSEGFGKYTNPAIRARPYDPAAAMRYFAAAGYTHRANDGILLNPRTGQRLSFQLTSRDTDIRKALPTLIDSAKKAGLEFRPEVLETTTFFKKTQEKKHDIALTAWQVVNKFPTYWEGFHMDNAIVTQPDGTIAPKRQTNNITSTRDPALSALIDKCRAATTEEAVQKLGYEIQQRIHDDAAFVPGYKVSTYRIASWRWMRYAPGFGVKNSDDIFETGTFWIDEDIKRETLSKRQAGQALPPVIRIHDQYRLSGQ